MPRAKSSAHHESDGTILDRDGHGHAPSSAADDCQVCRAYVAELGHAGRRPSRRPVVGGEPPYEAQSQAP